MEVNEDPGSNEVVRLTEAFKARPTPSEVAKLDMLLQLSRLDDPRIVPFLLSVVADLSEPNRVRIGALKWLNNGARLASYRRLAAEVIMQVLREDASPDLRLQSTLALAEFTDVDSVLTTLGGMVLDPAETIDVRYAAFSSLESGGPTPKCIALLRQLTADETFGPSARSLLSRWKLA